MISKLIITCLLQLIVSLFFIQSPDIIYLSTYVIGYLSFFILLLLLLNFKINWIRKCYIVIVFSTFQLLFVSFESYLHRISCIIYILANKEDLKHQVFNKMQFDRDFIYLKYPSLETTTVENTDLQGYLKKNNYLMVLKEKNNATIHFRFKSKKFRLIRISYCPADCESNIIGNKKLINNWYSQIIY